MLKGVKVVEIGQAFAAPYAAAILAQLGAEVIKVEQPGAGDAARGWGPPFWGEDAAVFHAVNAGKRSVALDLKDPADLAAYRALLAEADVLAHNLRPGALERIGLGSDALAEDFPRLIYAEISAFGHAGPMKDQAGYEILAQAFGGVMSMTGEADRAPVRCGPSVCDLGSGMWLAIGVLAALHRRAETGRGGLVQTSLLETALSWTTVSAASWLASGAAPGRMGASHGLIAPYGYFETKTGPIMVACASDGIFKRLAGALGRPEWSDDPRYRDNPSRVAVKAELETEVGRLLAAESLEHWVEVFAAAGVPCAPVNTVPEAWESDQAQALAMLNADPKRPEVRTPALPLSFNGARPDPKAGAPRMPARAAQDAAGG